MAVGDKDSKGNLLILGGRIANLWRTASGMYFVGTEDEFESSISPTKAIELFNKHNGQGTPLDYIEKWFQPWYERNVLKLSEERVVIEVPSASNPEKSYKVKYSKDGYLTCECPGFRYRSQCWHLEAAKELLASGEWREGVVYGIST